MATTRKAAKTVIAHVSDLHIGSYLFSEPLLRQTIAEVNGLGPDIVVVGGDLTNMGLLPEYNLVREYLNQIDCPRVMVVPGNHDARNVGYLHFERLFERRDRATKVDGVVLVGVDSSQPDLDDGHVGRERYPWIRRSFGSGPNYKIFVLHHHLVSVPGTGRERNIVHDAGDLLEVLIEAGVQMVLSGHKHVPYVWRLEDMLIVNAGTVSSMKLRGDARACYNIIEVQKGQARVFRKHPGGARDRVA